MIPLREHYSALTVTQDFEPREGEEEEEEVKSNVQRGKFQGEKETAKQIVSA